MKRAGGEDRYLLPQRGDGRSLRGCRAPENEEDRAQPLLGREEQPLIAQEAVHQFYYKDLISCLYVS